MLLPSKRQAPSRNHLLGHPIERGISEGHSFEPHSPCTTPQNYDGAIAAKLITICLVPAIFSPISWPLKKRGGLLLVYVFFSPPPPTSDDFHLSLGEGGESLSREPDNRFSLGNESDVLQIAAGVLLPSQDLSLLRQRFPLPARPKLLPKTNL